MTDTETPYVRLIDSDEAFAVLNTGIPVPLFLLDYVGNVGQCHFFNDGRHVRAPDFFFMFGWGFWHGEDPQWLCLKCVSRLYVQMNLRQMIAAAPIPETPANQAAERKHQP
jgi:hypothetical protein